MDSAHKMDLSVDPNGECTDDSAFYDCVFLKSYQENHVISSLQSTKLQQGLQQVFTDLHSSKQMITNLQRELHHTRTLWANESLQYTATAAQLQQSSVKLLERHFRVPDGPSHIGVISSSSSPEISGPMLQRREPNVATMGTAQHAQQVDPSRLHERLRMMIATASEALRSTPRSDARKRQNAPTHPAPQSVKSSGLYLMIDAATGHPLGQTILNAETPATTQTALPHECVILHGTASPVDETSPVVRSCHTQTMYDIVDPTGDTICNTSIDIASQNSTSWQASHMDEAPCPTLSEHATMDGAVGVGLTSSPTCAKSGKVNCDLVEMRQKGSEPCNARESTHVEGHVDGPAMLHQEKDSHAEQLWKVDGQDAALPVQENPKRLEATAGGDRTPMDTISADSETSQGHTPHSLPGVAIPGSGGRNADIRAGDEEQPAMSEPSFDLLQPILDSCQNRYASVADASDFSLDRVGTDGAGGSDAHTDGTGTSLLTKSIADSISQLAETIKPPYNNASDRHSTQSRRSSIVPADELLPHMPFKPLQTDASKSMSTAIFGLLKEESDVFEEDAPLNFLKPASRVVQQAKGGSKAAAPSKPADSSGFDWTRPSMDASVGSHDGYVCLGNERHSGAQSKRKATAGSPKPLADVGQDSLDVADFDF